MPYETGDPWEISEKLFPWEGSFQEQMTFLLNYAVLAPSSHNTQPWLFRFHGRRLELYADRTRALPVVDPMDRELIMSCGAALFHLRIAMRYFGLGEAVQTFPDPEIPDLVALVGVTGKSEATSGERDLFRAIPVRRTYRLAFDERPIPEVLLSQLQAAAGEEGVCLHVVEGMYSRSAIADLIEEGDKIQWSDPRFRRELAAWVHPNRSLSRDGIPGFALGMPNLISNVAPFAFRTFDLGKGRAAKDRQLALSSPSLAVLATVADEPLAWLAAGQALSRLLLRARIEGVFASFLNQPIEVESLRPKIPIIIGTNDSPQILLRLGFGKHHRPTPRRPVSEVLLPPR
jgi:hypothetical protein